MRQLSYSLIFGLVFMVLQVSTVEAQTGAPVLTIGDPTCATVPPAAGCPAGSPGFMAPPVGDPNMPPPTMAPPMGDPNMPPPTMAPPMGDPNMPPT
jgi:hypothetical protein